jgi:hypothetical protein
MKRKTGYRKGEKYILVRKPSQGTEARGETRVQKLAQTATWTL